MPKIIDPGENLHKGLLVPYAKGMLRRNTPIDFHEEWGLWVKREDLSCPNPGPPFSKTRGVFAHIEKRPETLIGVLDTLHSQAGHAVARACQVLRKKCINFYPHYKAEIEGVLRGPQLRAKSLGATPYALPAGRSCILFHRARKEIESRGGYMMPNALKLKESVEETAKEVPLKGDYKTVIIPSSSGTIAAGVIKGFLDQKSNKPPSFIVHLGYSRSHGEVINYLRSASGHYFDYPQVRIVDEKYAYKDKARNGPTPDWPCNDYYDLKAFRWFVSQTEETFTGPILFWNVG